jgi:hypothetical protein
MRITEPHRVAMLTTAPIVKSLTPADQSLIN